MSIQQRDSSKSIDGNLYSALLKPSDLYISESDPRNNPQFIKDYPGTVHVLNAEDFAKWLQQEIGGNVKIPDSITGFIPNDSEAKEDIQNATFVSDPKLVPTNLIWDSTDPDSVHYQSSDSGVYLNVKILFDSALSDPDDGSYIYHIHYEPGVLNGIDNTNQGASTTAPIDDLQVIATSSTIVAHWTQIPNATRYAVQVIGSYLPDSSGSAVSDYAFEWGGKNLSSASSHALLTLVKGYYTFELSKGAHNFTGTYTVGVKAIYQAGSSTEVSTSATV